MYRFLKKIKGIINYSPLSNINLKIALVTKEFERTNYGGAGIHVTHLFHALQSISTLSVQIISIHELQYQDYRGHANIDIFHCHTWYSFEAGMQFKELYQKKLLLTFHSVEKKRPWKINQVGEKKHLYICELEKRAAQLADGIIAVSHQCKQDIIDAYEISAHKIHVIYNGINPQMQIHPIDFLFLERWNIDIKKPSILIVNRISEQKDIKFLFESLENIHASWQILLCLNSPDDDNIYAFTKTKIQSLRKPMIWIDKFISQKNLSSLYQIADVFISTAKYEPYGLTTAEAIMHRCPVIARDAGGIQEIITQSRGGIVCSLNTSPQDFSKLVNSFLDKNTRETFQAQIDEEKLWHWDKVATETSNIYFNLLNHQ